MGARGHPLRQLREDLELILAEARRAGDIVHGLLASARQDPPEWRIVSLADVVRRTVGLCRHHLKLHNITLQAPYFDPQDGYPLWSRVRGDANQLQQVLLNLLINAQQAITAARGYGTVRITLAPDGPDRIVLTVEDDGPGVPDDQRDSDLPPVLHHQAAGTGHRPRPVDLGRGSCGPMAGRSPWSAHAQRRGRVPRRAALAGRRPIGPWGTTRRAEAGGAVTVPLPAREASASPGTQHRVLLVDDEAGIRRSVGRYLRRSGYQVTDVPSAQAALNALATARYDVIISDLRMPGALRRGVLCPAASRTSPR